MKIPHDRAGQRFDAVLAELLPDFSRSRLASWMKEGRVLLNQQAADPKKKVSGGESVEVQPPAVDARTGLVLPEELDIPTVYSDDSLIVVNKPAGLVVHPGSGNWSGTLMNALLFHYAETAQVPRAGIVHRLDKETSGLMVVARTLMAQTDLVRQLQARTVSRRYYALVWGKPAPKGCIEAPIGRHSTQRTKMAVVSQGREARTFYRVLAQFAACALVECKLDTGRTHQIRVHMAHIGHSLVGDPVYGRPPRNVAPELLNFPRQALHAHRLALQHPVSRQECAWKSELPDDMARLLLNAGGSDTLLSKLNQTRLREH